MTGAWRDREDAPELPSVWFDAAAVKRPQGGASPVNLALRHFGTGEVLATLCASRVPSPGDVVQLPDQGRVRPYRVVRIVGVPTSVADTLFGALEPWVECLPV